MQWSKERREHWLEIEEVTVSIDWLGSHFDWKKQSRVFLVRSYLARYNLLYVGTRGVPLATGRGKGWSLARARYDVPVR